MLKHACTFILVCCGGVHTLSFSVTVYCSCPPAYVNLVKHLPNKSEWNVLVHVPLTRALPSQTWIEMLDMAGFSYGKQGWLG